MNEHEQYPDDEYHFISDDSGMGEPIEPESTPAPAAEETASGFNFKKLNMQVVSDFFKKNSPARNALVAITIFIFLMVLYKIASEIFSGHVADIQKAPTPTQMIKPKIVPAPVVTTLTQEQPHIDVLISQKLSTVEQNQAMMQSQITSMNNQIVSLNTNLGALTDKLNQLTTQMTQLASTLQEQSQVVMTLKERTKPKPIVVKRIHPHPHHALKYYLQAVIPGRGWLIATNGSTLTVRVGTIIPGYGVVRAIDSTQGVVLTSSGKMIRFSQEDS